MAIPYSKHRPFRASASEWRRGRSSNDGRLSLWVGCMYDLPMIRINIFLPERVVAALKALSEKTGLSYAEHIRRAIDAYLKKEK